MSQNYALSSKIKIACGHGKPSSVKKHIGFYTTYSRFILKALKKASFQDFLYQMLLSECIEEKTVNTIDISVFPDITKNGLNVVGRCNPFRGSIRIYPKNFYFCDTLRKKQGKEMLYAFVGNRARAALIHELLHLKYVSDEAKVRELTDTYFCVYSKTHIGKNPVLLYSLIFNKKKPDKKSVSFQVNGRWI